MKKEAQTLTALIRNEIATKRRAVNPAVKIVHAMTNSKTSIKMSRITSFRHKKLPRSETAVRKAPIFPLTPKSTCS